MRIILLKWYFWVSMLFSSEASGYFKWKWNTRVIHFLWECLRSLFCRGLFSVAGLLVMWLSVICHGWFAYGVTECDILWFIDSDWLRIWSGHVSFRTYWQLPDAGSIFSLPTAFVVHYPALVTASWLSHFLINHAACHFWICPSASVGDLSSFNRLFKFWGHSYSTYYSSCSISSW